jgi:hypothetical protein
VGSALVEIIKESGEKNGNIAGDVTKFVSSLSE